MAQLVLFIGICLASYRFTRLVVSDRVLSGARIRIQWWTEARYERKTGKTSDELWLSPVAYLLSCYWCSGFWVSGLVTLAAASTVGVQAPWLVWPAAAAAVGMISNWTE